MRLPADQLVGQFMLSQDPDIAPTEWSVRTKRSWILAAHPSLLIADIHTPDRTHIGWVAGYPIDGAEINPRQIVFPADAARSPEALESALYRLGGRFIGVFLTDAFARVYLDACGSLAAVYSTNQPIVASTPGFFDEAEHPWDEDLIRFLKMPASGLWYPFGLTPRQNVVRLIPNHVLDLNDWKTHRHWPKAPFRTETHVEGHVRRIYTTVRDTIAAVARAYPLHLSLTAGHDSRLLLACARADLDRIRFFTFARDRETADTHIARALARCFKLDHAILPIEQASPRQLAVWLARTGDCVSGDVATIHPTLRHLDPHRALLPGMAGEVGRAFYWRKGDNATTRLSPQEIVARCHLPSHARLAAKAAEWLSGLTGHDVFTVLDLLYVEQRLGCWGGPQQYGGDDRSACQLFPLAHREIFEAILSLPADYRGEERLALDICQLAWPELLDLPFNEFSGLQRYPRRIAKSLFLTARRAISTLRRR